MQVAGSSKSNAGRWTTWLLTKTHHTDMSNPEVPSRKRRSGDLGKLFHWDPLGTKFDKVEKYSWRDVGAVVGRIDLLYRALLCDEMLGPYSLSLRKLFSPPKYSSNLHFFDVSVSTLMNFLRIPYIIRPAAANVLPLTGWPPRIPQISISDCKTTLCRKRISHAFVEQKKLELNLWYLLSLKLCCPKCRALLSRQMKWKSKIVKISDLRIPWYVSSHVQAWGSMLNDMWHWALKDAFIKCVKYAFALWVLPVHDNHLLIFVTSSSQMNQVQERKSRRI